MQISIKKSPNTDFRLIFFVDFPCTTSHSVYMSSINTHSLNEQGGYICVWRENIYYRASHKRRQHFQVRDTKKKKNNEKKVLSMGENENASQQCDDGVS